LANIAKKHCFPKKIANFFAKIFDAENLPFFEMAIVTLSKQFILDYVSNECSHFRENIQPNINRCELSF